MYEDELLLKNVFVQIFSFVPLNHYCHRSCDCKPSRLLAVDMQLTRKKNLGPLIAHKEKLKEDLSRGNSIAFPQSVFVFHFFVTFGSPNILLLCLFVFV